MDSEQNDTSEERAAESPVDTPGASGKLDSARTILDQKLYMNYVTSADAPTYQAIMNVIYKENERFRIDLKADDIITLLKTSNYYYELGDVGQLEARLEQLVGWEILSVSHDMAAVRSLKDFYRRRNLYNLTKLGEAVHRHIIAIGEELVRSGSLQIGFLKRVNDSLAKLHRAFEEDNLDADGLYSTFYEMFSAFTNLTEEARVFMEEIEKHSRLNPLDKEVFLKRKSVVIHYIRRFMEELRPLQDPITELVGDLDGHKFHRLIEAANKAGDVPVTFIEDDSPGGSWKAKQQKLWEGMLSWFVSAGGMNPLVENFAAKTRLAVQDLLFTLRRLHEKRGQPVDRTADFLALAEMFEQCETEADAHKLWRSAFGMGPARHFITTETDPEMVDPECSYWDTEPSRVPPLLRSKRRIPKGGFSSVPDYSENKKWIRLSKKQEWKKRSAILQTFISFGPFKVSELPEMDSESFKVFLGFLAESYNCPANDKGARNVRSLDGKLNIRLTQPADGRRACLETEEGVLNCPDFYLEITEVTVTAEKDEFEEQAT